MFGRKLGGGGVRAGLLLIALALLCAAASAFTIDGYTFESGYEHTISNAGSALTDYQIAFTFNSASGTNTGNTIYTAGTTQSDWRDIRFTSSTGTVYPYWIESTTASTAYVWVKDASIPAGDSVIRIYYDSDTAVQASNGAATFPFFDDFGGTTLDTNKWTTSGAVTVTGGEVTGIIAGIPTFGSGYAFAARVKASSSGSDYLLLVGNAIAPSEQYSIRIDSGLFKYETYPPDPGPSTMGVSWDTSYHTVEIRRTAAGTGAFYLDGSLKGSRSGPTGAYRPVKFSSSSTWDWSLVRKISATELTHGTYGALAISPVAAFSASLTSGPAPLTVHFTDSSTNSPTSWAWDFGDGDTSTAQSPTHIYSVPGTYIVTLTATNVAGSDGEIKVGYITVTVPPPMAAFSYYVTGTAPITVHFADSSTNTPTSWNWSFGDGQTSTEQNPTHIYNSQGTYTVSMTATNAGGSDEISTVGYISVIVNAPVAQFAADPTSGLAPLSVQFTDYSSNNPASWSWNFGDGETSTDQSPTHVYSNPGSYTVSLSATNVGGTDSESKAGYITVTAITLATTGIPGSSVVAAFYTDVGAGPAPLTVHFTDTSTGSPISWAWDFDGNGVADSTERNPTHIYANNGTYTVTLQVSDGTTTDLETKTDLIGVGVLTAKYLKASFRYTGAGGTVPHIVNFEDTTKTDGGTYARTWDFGDGESSTEANPAHEYTTAGKYDISLTVQSATKSNTAEYKKIIAIWPNAAGTPLPTNTYGVHMTEIMDSNWNLSVIAPILPMAYTDMMPATLFWGLLFAGVFFMMFIRQGTPWLLGILGLISGASIMSFLPPEFQAIGQGLLCGVIGGFLCVLLLGRLRSN